jgi:phytoene desaturase
MVMLAQEMGVTLRPATAVEEILVENRRAVGVRLQGGEVVSGDRVISNADLPYTYQTLIPSRHRKRYSDRRIQRMKYACSGYLLYLGVDRTYEHVRHQSIYFSENYRANLDAIFKNKTIPVDPSFHLSIPTVTDASLAPPGHSLLYILAPVPNLTADINWNLEAPRMRQILLERLEMLIDPGLRQHIVWEKEYRPDHFLKDFNAYHGTAFGSLAHGFFQSSFFRPHNVARDIARLYFVGQGTYPGIGMPMVQLSAKLVTERIMKECR